MNNTPSDGSVLVGEQRTPLMLDWQDMVKRSLNGKGVTTRIFTELWAVRTEV